jgi:cell shape-determining protein MreC
MLRMMIFFVENANNFDDEDVIESFVSSLESPIHDSYSQKEIIERLKNKILEFELKVQSYEFKLQNLEKNCQMHLGEVATLKVKVQTLETENRALKSTCISTSITSMNLDKVIGQRPRKSRVLDINFFLRFQIALNQKRNKVKGQMQKL